MHTAVKYMKTYRKFKIGADIYLIFFISLIHPNWTPHKQAKIISLENSFSQRYSNFKFEKFDSEQAHTAESNLFDKLAH